MSHSLLLVVEDDETIAFSLRTFFSRQGYTVVHASDGKTGIDLALKELPDAVLLDMRLPDISGFEVLSEIKRVHPEISVIVMTGYGEIDDAVNAMKSGAEYYFQKPIDLDKLQIIVEKSLGIRQIREEVRLHKNGNYPIVGRSRHIQGLIQVVGLLAANPSTTVLIMGETGTGKEVIARNIHALSSRAGKPFLDINCAAIPEHILESELFGYEAGAFTDAKKTKKGLIELAEGGTMFLDEIGDMPVSSQAKMLRVIDTRTLKRLGGTRDISIDVRIIAATNKNLEEAVKHGHFREDLYYRLNVMPVTILPLRERAEDIPLLAEFLLKETMKTMGKKRIHGFEPGVFELLSSYDWPGNVRELRNVIERAAILCNNSRISAGDLTLPQRPASDAPLALKEMEKTHIRKVLDYTGGNVSRAAQILGIARSTLNEKIKMLSIK